MVEVNGGETLLTMSQTREKLRFRDYWNEKVKINRDDSIKVIFLYFFLAVICSSGVKESGL